MNSYDLQCIDTIIKALHCPLLAIFINFGGKKINNFIDWIRNSWLNRDSVKLLFLWLIIYSYFFSFCYQVNEVDVLPSALQFVNQTWLPNDWYLNLSISYRQPFNLIAGSFITLLGFQYSAYLGRAVVYLLLSISLFTYFKTFRLRYTFALAGLLFFFKNQSLIACEWIIGGFDTKTIAYSFVFLSLSYLYKNI
ncbi:MAG: hypothetical protein GQF41_4546 [Candidatus Rifleibacterium amylolyticum]|nr:MAG: hypothetical protein GQF41_4546 [Candidatus Rifleibacterium amylolyticum]